MKNLLLLYGGGSNEHDISKITCSYLKSQIDTKKYNVFVVEMSSGNEWLYEDQQVELDFKKNLKQQSVIIAKIDIVIPCIHGYPAESGDLQSYFKLINLPFLGVESESSKICFNKALTKLWLQSQKLPTAPFIFINNKENLDKALDFLKLYKKVFIKSSNQGSSIGCYSAESENQLKTSIKEAFSFSKYVLIEPFIHAREVEVAVFEYQNKIHTSFPGEILCPEDFYDYKQKYAKESKTQIDIRANNITPEIVNKLQELSLEVFTSFGLKDLSRIDFFLTQDGEIFINEINTFPGMTPISLFPQMIEMMGVKFKDFIKDRLDSL